MLTPPLSLPVLMLGLQISFYTWPFHRESELGHPKLLVDILPSPLLSILLYLERPGVLFCFALFQCNLETEILGCSEMHAEVAGQASEDNAASVELPGEFLQKNLRMYGS